MSEKRSLLENKSKYYIQYFSSWCEKECRSLVIRCTKEENHTVKVDHYSMDIFSFPPIAHSAKNASSVYGRCAGQTKCEGEMMFVVTSRYPVYVIYLHFVAGIVPRRRSV